MANAGLGGTSSLLPWVGSDSNNWSVLSTTATIFGTSWTIGSLDVVTWTTAGSQIAIALQNLLGGDLRWVVE